ncbi:MAG TPA: outer membrane protein assembly factor BamE [Rhodocyclaceae bacterium]|nr:outer membrane protein assembly factor BamE [Rhodocyclaceae bacterium]
MMKVFLQVGSLLLSLALVLAMTGCAATADQLASSSLLYRVDVRQGNYVTQDMVAQLKPGLTRDQVRFILGSPLLVDMFHSDRWDYVYRFQSGQGATDQRKLTVFFQDNKLLRVAGDVVTGVAGAPTPSPADK